MVTILTYLTNSLSFLSDFCWNKDKNKPKQPLLYSLFKILKKPALVQKPTILHMKALILSYLEPEGWGRGITMGAPRPPPVKLFATFLSEVMEAKRVDFLKKKLIRSNVRISWMHRYRFYDLKVHFWWSNKRLFSYNQRWKTL